MIDLANFVENEMTLVNDPLYSREPVSQYLVKRPTRQDHRGGNSIQWLSRQTIHQKVKGNKTSSERTCPVCSEKHDFEE